MKGYSCDLPEECACSRVEDVNASYKDLSEVCGRIKNKKSGWAVDFLEKAAAGEVAVLYRRHNKKLGHRSELGGRKGRYPKKAAAIVLKALQSAVANGGVRGLGTEYRIFHASANKRHIYPRMASKGRQSRSYLVTSRVEIVLTALNPLPKGVEVRAPQKQGAVQREAQPAKPAVAQTGAPGQKPQATEAKAARPQGAVKEAKPAEKQPEAKPPADTLKGEAVAEKQHKHELEKDVHHEHPRTAYEHEKGRKTPVNDVQ